MAFTVAWVPTGMKAGVAMFPWGVVKEPRRAAFEPSFFMRLKLIDDKLKPISFQGSKFKVQSSRFEVQGSKFKVQSSRFKVQGSKFKVRGSRFEVQGSRFEISTPAVKL
jgi:hypothetical protein